jgi:hypothetical protein
MSLKAELDAFRADSTAKLPLPIRRAVARADLKLAASGVLERALRAATECRTSNCPDVRASCIRLNDLCWRKDPSY